MRTDVEDVRLTEVLIDSRDPGTQERGGVSTEPFPWMYVVFETTGQVPGCKFRRETRTLRHLIIFLTTWGDTKTKTFLLTEKHYWSR